MTKSQSETVIHGKRNMTAAVRSFEVLVNFGSVQRTQRGLAETSASCQPLDTDGIRSSVNAAHCEFNTQVINCVRSDWTPACLLSAPLGHVEKKGEQRDVKCVRTQREKMANSSDFAMCRCGFPHCVPLHQQMHNIHLCSCSALRVCCKRFRVNEFLHPFFWWQRRGGESAGMFAFGARPSVCEPVNKYWIIWHD